MPSRYSDAFVRNEREEQITAMADRLAALFAERAAVHDEEGSFPFDHFAELRKAGYLKLTVPQEYGGDGASLYETLLAQERLGRGDGSTALAVGWHIGLMLHYSRTRLWPEDLFAEFCREVVEDGALINVFASEPATGSPARGGRFETKAARTEGGWLISGRKTYCTLSPILRHFIVSASLDGEEGTADFLVRSGPGIHVDETWNTLGMRATGSHDVILKDVFVPDRDRITRADRAQGPHEDDGNGWMLHIPACYLGIAWAARDFAIRYARDYRPNSLPGPIADLAHIQDKIGAIEEKLITARTLLYSVADRWDRDPQGQSALRNELGLAKTVAVNNAISVVDIAMRIVGGASLSRKLPLERWYRDVRAGLHNPPMEDAVRLGLARRALQEKA